MPVESASDLAGMFDAAEFGTLVMYRPADDESFELAGIFDIPVEAFGGSMAGRLTFAAPLASLPEAGRGDQVILLAPLHMGALRLPVNSRLAVENAEVDETGALLRLTLSAP